MVVQTITLLVLNGDILESVQYILYRNDESPIAVQPENPASGPVCLLLHSLDAAIFEIAYNEKRVKPL
jgi:hypothetical protein